MRSLYRDPKAIRVTSIDNAALSSLIYHSLFDYPLGVLEIDKWAAGPKSIIKKEKLPHIEYFKGYFVLSGKRSNVIKKQLRETESQRKMKIAQRAAKIISRIPTIKMVGVTGSLAMSNADENADIDLMIVTSHRTLWTSRLVTYLLLKLLKLKIRTPKNAEEKDHLCLNIWLDEKYLLWEEDEKNIYIAHEIAQVIPLYNKDQTYERFVWENRWIRDYWPNAAKIIKVASKKYSKLSIFSLLENIARKLQLMYMKDKITKERVSPYRALFHPVDLSESVQAQLWNQ